MTLYRVNRRRDFREYLSQGIQFPHEIAIVLERLFGQAVSKEGLSKVFQPQFAGLKPYVVQATLTSNRFVEFLVIGIARDGRPIWSAERSIGLGRDGSIELHHGNDFVDEDFRPQNILNDCLENEIQLLQDLDAGPNPRITFDAHGEKSYKGALHGAVFADDTDEGPPVQSIRALEPDGDKRQVINSAVTMLRGLAEKQGLPAQEVERAAKQIENIKTPFDLAQINIDQFRGTISEEEKKFASPLGRALCLGKKLPSWRGALYPKELPEHAKSYRNQHRDKAESTRSEEIRTSLEVLSKSNHSAQIKALRALGRLAPAWLLPEIKAHFEHSHRGIAVVARQVAKQISDASLHEKIALFSNNRKHDGRLRGFGFRVLSEYYPQSISQSVALLRVNPDARIQRSIIPILAADQNGGPQLASLLTANPRSHRDTNRPGLDELRLELIECLSKLDDTRIIPSLMCALTALPPPPPQEVLALSRALVSHPDPRAQPALNIVSQRLARPLVP
ncbi:MAG: hypothetical protein VYC39_04335 [Myxococcota bacterium]|nr:hypothetical protein [Myxococcota bacterium]